MGLAWQPGPPPSRVVMLMPASWAFFRCRRRSCARPVDRSKTLDGFGESRRGDVPEGTAELMTSETDKAIKTGLAWLARSQNRRRIVRRRDLPRQHRGDQPGGAGVHGVGLEPGPRSVWRSRSTRHSSMSWTTPRRSGFIAVAAQSTHGPMYSHGFGTLFLAEAYGMTHRPEIREKLQKAVRLIIDCAERRRRLEVSAETARCRPVGDDLPDQRAAGGAERRALTFRRKRLRRASAM